MDHAPARIGNRANVSYSFETSTSRHVIEKFRKIGGPAGAAPFGPGCTIVAEGNPISRNQRRGAGSLVTLQRAGRCGLRSSR